MDTKYLKIESEKLIFTELFFQDCMVNTLNDGSIKVSKAILLSDTSHEQVSKFKYISGKTALEGLWRYQLNYEQQGTNKQAIVLVKAKPGNDKIFAIVQKILDGCHVSLEKPLSYYLGNTEFSNGSFKETLLFSEYGIALKKHIPQQLGIYIDINNNEFIRIEETLSADTMAGTADDISQWNNEHISKVITSLAEIHAIWYGKTDNIKPANVFIAMNTERMLILTEMWQKMAAFIHNTYKDLVTKEIYQFQQHCIATVSEWTAKADLMKKTIIYDDCNPKNIAFRKIDKQLTPCFYDWERALIGLPQHDVAELLCYVLPENFSGEQLNNYIDLQRLKLQEFSQITINQQTWREGFLYSLYYLLLNRFSFHLAVQHVFADRPYVLRSYKVLWRMLKIFAS